jgi:hypothetical protein
MRRERAGTSYFFSFCRSADLTSCEKLQVSFRQTPPVPNLRRSGLRTNSRIAFLDILFCLAISPGAVWAANYQVIEIYPGQDVDIYFEINLSGTVALRIETMSGPGCAELWWIRWPLGNIASLGKRCGSFRLPIPGVTEFTLSAKLRAAGVDRRTKIIAAANERVANSATLQW